VAGLVAGALVQRKPVDKLLAGIVIAGSANLVNLLDLRPGRAIKAGLIAGAPVAMARSGSGRRRPGRHGAGVLAAGSMGAAARCCPRTSATRDAWRRGRERARRRPGRGGRSRLRSGRAAARAASMVGLTLAARR
jgi:hypothetical protein